MSDVYTPPKVWSVDGENGGQFASINRPTAGAREEKALPVGEHPFQLYSLGTPNGVKVTTMFEELLEAGFSDCAHFSRQFKAQHGFTPSDARARAPVAVQSVAGQRLFD